ncbi:unnamed protein product [Paramecium primaurelia]|uniref:Uncharacterized protein n=1 Tax=Paramecium primaurelia TaxID=5886 RepID=A0A8S1PQR2_PARPR|nr:unnamed protein product [Paramecium primaurelia]
MDQHLPQAYSGSSFESSLSSSDNSQGEENADQLNHKFVFLENPSYCFICKQSFDSSICEHEESDDHERFTGLFILKYVFMIILSDTLFQWQQRRVIRMLTRSFWNYQHLHQHLYTTKGSPDYVKYVDQLFSSYSPLYKQLSRQEQLVYQVEFSEFYQFAYEHHFRTVNTSCLQQYVNLKVGSKKPINLDALMMLTSQFGLQFQKLKLKSNIIIENDKCSDIYSFEIQLGACKFMSALDKYNDFIRIRFFLSMFKFTQINLSSLFTLTVDEVQVYDQQFLFRIQSNLNFVTFCLQFEKLPEIVTTFLKQRCSIASKDIKVFVFESSFDEDYQTLINKLKGDYKHDKQFVQFLEIVSIRQMKHVIRDQLNSTQVISKLKQQQDLNQYENWITHLNCKIQKKKNLYFRMSSYRPEFLASKT